MTERKAKEDSRSTRVYMENAVQRVFRASEGDPLTKLLSGDRETIERCATYLARNLDCFQLLHTLCLLTGKRYDLEEKDPIKAADRWVCWWEEEKDKVAWDLTEERWKKKP